MAYSTDAVNACLANYWKEKRSERILMWNGDPVWERLYSRLQAAKSVKDHGRQFSFDVTYGASVRTTQGGTGGDINVGENGQTLAVGTDARALTHAAFAVQEHDLTALNTPEQLSDFLVIQLQTNGIQLQQWLAETFLCGSAASNDPDLGFAGICSLNGGDATPVSYTSADGTSRHGIINLQPEADQITAAITRHGISAGTVARWVSRFVDNSGGSWGADTQVEAADELHMLCCEGFSVFNQDGSMVTHNAPDLGLCTSRGYRRYAKWLRGNVRYAKGEDNGSDSNYSTRSGTGGGLLFGEKTPLYYCRTWDRAVTAGTAFVGYGGVLMFLNSKTWGVRYVNSAGANAGSNRQRGRVWRFRLMPERLEKDTRDFKGSAEQQIFCHQINANGGMKGWDQA